ncbi:MAG TPA: serine hydrolase [Ignavibacteria bacterium]|nr:serine hydrolase [Bacteroidota bacterium]HRI85652.1 serine hydrolase [Ignavibacteria bacterium]HRJ99213.1 serine hydrolase [Ignavibacteria bacterium]
MLNNFFSVLILFYLNSFSFAQDFSEVDNVILSGISDNAFPGAQLLVGNDKDIIYQKSYGNFTYDLSSPKVNDNSLFDIASVTKVVATTTAVMKLYEDNKIDLNEYVIKFIPEFSGGGKDNITVLNLLLHNSGLKAWIPFYKSCYSKSDVLYEICNTDLSNPTNSKFVYSDLNAILLGIIVEKVSGKYFDEYCRQNIFDILGMKNTFFDPDENMKQNILPTEYDSYWRFRQLQGEVHDEVAAVMGGVSGNAGLFSNSVDLFKFMQMMLNEGNYFNPYSRGLKNEKMFNAETVNLFTEKFSDLQYENTRALGWDTKPDGSESKYRIPCGEIISENSFGHTGYTGTSVWCDKDIKIIIIFLTNRVYPSRDNNGIREIRPEVHNKVIEALSK